MNTVFLLMAEFGQADIPVALIADKYLGLSVAEAKKRAARSDLPFPAYKAGTQKSPSLVAVTDLAAHLDREREKARKDWEALQKVRRED